MNPLGWAFIFGLIQAVLVAACTATPFVLGDEVQPPYGCLEARGRGHEC